MTINRIINTHKVGFEKVRKIVFLIYFPTCSNNFQANFIYPSTFSASSYCKYFVKFVNFVKVFRNVADIYYVDIQGI